MKRCEVRKAIHVTLSGKGTLKLGRPPNIRTIQVSFQAPDEPKVTPVDDLASPPAGLLLAAHVPPLDGLDAGSRKLGGGGRIRLPGVIDLSYLFDLDVEVRATVNLDVYTDCPPPHCVEGQLNQLDVDIELWQVVGPDQKVSGTKFALVQAGKAPPRFGMCFSPPWTNCCERAHVANIQLPLTAITLIPDVAEVRLSGAAQVEFMVYDTRPPASPPATPGTQPTTPKTQAPPPKEPSPPPAKKKRPRR